MANDRNMFLLIDEHARGKLTATGVVTSWNWLRFLHDKRPNDFGKREAWEDHPKNKAEFGESTNGFE